MGNGNVLVQIGIVVLLAIAAGIVAALVGMALHILWGRWGESIEEEQNWSAERQRQLEQAARDVAAHEERVAQEHGVSWKVQPYSPDWGDELGRAQRAYSRYKSTRQREQ